MNIDKFIKEVGNISSEFIDEAVDFRNERRRSVMTKRIKRIAAVAASLMLCIGIVGTAAFIGIKSIRTRGELSLEFLGFDTESGEAMAYLNGKEGLKVVSLGNYTITDEDGEEVSKEYDTIINTLAYWPDENGDLHFTNIPIGAYKIESEMVYDENGDIIHGSWELDFNFEDWPYGISTIDPQNYYAGSVEDGTAYDADNNDITVEFVDADENQTVYVLQIDGHNGIRKEKYVETDKGDKVLKITVNSDASPFNDIQTIGVSNYLLFDANAKYSIGYGIKALFPLEGSHATPDFDWGLLCIQDDQFYVLSNGEDQGRKYTVKIYAFLAELSDGTVVEIHGDWVVTFTV